MNGKYTIVMAIVAIAIIIGSVVAYVYFAQPSTSNPNASITLNGAVPPSRNHS